MGNKLMLPIVVEQTFNKRPKEIWEAITDVKKMRQWYFENIPSFIPELGFETKFIVKAAGRDFLHFWKVINVNSISYNWSYEGIEGNSIIIFDIHENNEFTKLVVTHTITDNFPDDMEEFSHQTGLAGWKYFINERLPDFLNEEND